MSFPIIKSNMFYDRKSCLMELYDDIPPLSRPFLRWQGILNVINLNDSHFAAWTFIIFSVTGHNLFGSRTWLIAQYCCSYRVLISPL